MRLAGSPASPGLLARLASLAAAVALAGCSLALDPDDLRAELLVTRDGQDTGDTTADTTTSTDSTTSTATTDTSTTTATDSSTTDVDDATDTTTRALIVRWSGQDPSTCTLVYRKDLTGCPKACPDAEGWTLVIDASESTGIGAFNWRFAATNNYGVTPTQAVGPRVTLTVTPPDCALLAGADVGPGSIAVELATDGGAFAPQPAIRWGVLNISGLTCDSPNDCPDP